MATIHVSSEDYRAGLPRVARKYRNYSTSKSERLFSGHFGRGTTRVLFQDDGTRFTDKSQRRVEISEEASVELQASLVLFWLLVGDLRPVMDERTQTLPTAQYRTGVREDVDATRAIRNIYTFPPRDIAVPEGMR